MPTQPATHIRLDPTAPTVATPAVPVALALSAAPRSVGRLMRSRSCRILFLAVPLAFSACGDQRVAAYRIPKEKEPDSPSAAHAHASAGVTPGGGAGAAAQDAGNDMANTAVATAGGAGLTWTAPAHWQSKAASAMRKATFTISGDGGATAELAVTAFPGDVGGEVANVNRWRGQIQLPSAPEAEVGGSITRLEANGLPIAFVELVNPSAAPPVRVLGAWVPFQDSTWFFKLTGPDALVAREKPAFVQFLNTIKADSP
jgi:hypothetical protein